MRTARCRCGALTATCSGEPVRISVCHCLECQRRTGSAFGAQARFRIADVIVAGASKLYTRIADSGTRANYSFCPHCGSTICYTNDDLPDLIAIPLGAFADPLFPEPTYSVYEHRKHPWVRILGDGVMHEALPE